MKKIYTKKLLAVIFVLTAFISKAQLPYSEPFNGACTTSWPLSWTANDPDWIVDDNLTTCAGALPECAVLGSSKGSMMLGADGSSGLETTTSASVNASIYSNLTVDWNGYRTTGAPALTLEYSFNNTTWVNVPFTDVPTDDAWHALTTVNLPPACDNAPVLYLRWSYTGTALGSLIGIDDIVLNGTSLNTFYWNGGGLHLTTSWGAFPTGGGPNPLSFSAAGQTFNVYNSTLTPVSAVLTAPWAVSGGSVNIFVGNGTTIPAKLTIPSGFALTLTNATLNVQNTSTLTIQNTTFPVAGLVNVNTTGSTIEWAQASPVTMWSKTYANITISGGAFKSQSGNTTINGQLNVSSASDNLSMSNSPALNLYLAGTITGPGSLLYGNSRLHVLGSGAFGTIRFAAGSSTYINNLTVNRTSGDVNLGSNLVVNGASAFTNGTVNINGNNLTMKGAVTFPVLSTNGAFTGSNTSSLTITASAGNLSNSMWMDQTSASTRALYDLSLNRNGKTLTLGNPLEIWNSIDPTDGSVAGGSNLTLKSDATHKGRIGPIGPGTFSGNPTVELYKDAGLTNWVNMCSSGVNGQSMSNWNSSFAITCLTCPDGSQVGGVTFTSIYTYDETGFVGDETNALHYIEITALGALDSKVGYWVFLGNGFPNTTAITIPLTGAVNTKGSSGAIPLTATAVSPNDGWNLIANPYPSPILVSQVVAAGGGNVDATLYAYDSNLETNVPFSASGSNSIIPMGQAFSIRALAGSVNLTPSESWKTTSNSNAGLLKTSAASAYFWNDFLLDLTSTTFNKPFYSNTYFMFDPTCTTGFDNGKDAYLTGNSVLPGLPMIYSSTGGAKFLKNALPSLSGTVIIPLTITTATAGIFQINPVNINKLPAGACVKLYDVATATLHDLKTGAYTATVSANATTPMYELRITVTPGTMTSNVNHPLCSKGTNGSVIAKGSSAGPWNYTWKDASNNIIKTALNKATADTLKNIGVGSYQVDVNTTGSCDNANASFALVSTAPLPTSAFTVNKDTLNINGTIQFVFTNASSNANTYFWQFGDGNTSTVQNPSYMYTTAGNYNVHLSAINSACSDTAKYTHLVHAVNSPTLQSVLSYQNNDNSIKVGKDGNGVYVELNFDKSTKATVSVNNVLGQTLISPKQIEGTTDKFYIDINAKEQLLFVTVTTADKRFTQRIFYNQ